MDLFAVAHENATSTVVADFNGRPVEWRIKRVRSSDLAQHYSAIMLGVPTTEITGEGEAALSTRQKPEDVGRSFRELESVCCAGVTGARAQGETDWADITLVMEERQHEQSRRRLWVGHLPFEAVRLIGAEILTLSALGVADRLRPFPGGAGAAPDAGPTGQTVRHDAG